MRTLMLHGHATSAMIFKAQTVPFRSKLDPSFAFDFIDGPYSCPPPKGLSSVISSAYTWTKSPEIDSIHDSVKWLTHYLETNEPYDCICCFSKAAVVVLATLMYDLREAPEERSRIAPKALVFINGSLEYSFLEDLGLPIPREARQIKFKTEALVKAKTEDVSKLARTMVRPGAGNGLWDDTRRLMHDATKMPPASSCFGINFTLLPQNIMIRIPTVHIVGAKDPIWPSGVQISNLCDPDQRTFYDHKGGHDLPRTPQIGADIAKLFRELDRRLGV